jgi:thiol-disulfide isomerase/thioredoxin
MRIGALLACAALALAAAGCGGGAKAKPLTRGQITAQLAGSPPALARLHSQAGDLIGGGVPAFRARLASLRGHPVIVNRWAAWCGPCRSEFGILQRVGLQMGRKIAFLGVDAEDVRASALGFLSRNLVPYPSYADPHSAISRSLKATVGLPITNFYDARGRLVFQHAGPYTTEKALIADIARYS